MRGDCVESSDYASHWHGKPASSHQLFLLANAAYGRKQIGTARKTYKGRAAVASVGYSSIPANHFTRGRDGASLSQLTGKIGAKRAQVSP